MEIISGLFDRMVLQRDTDNWVELAAPTTGDVYQHVGKSWKKIGHAPRFKLARLKAGGPYAIALEVRQGDRVEKLTVRDVLVGDVWIAAGQSNMQGCGRREFADKPHPQVRAFYMDDQWREARDPIHNMWDCVDQVHIDISGKQSPNTTHGVGPAVAFAQEMRRLTGVPQGVLACAHGGTSMTQWDPKRRDELGKSLYGATYRRLQKNGGRIAGVIWYQGESDANPDAVPLYTARMKELIAAFRRDAGDQRLPFVLVQISRVTNWGAGAGAPWNAIQDQQQRLQRLIPRVATVPAIDLTLDDLIHIGGPSNTRLGKRLAQAMHAVRTGKGKLPILPGKPKLEADPVDGQAVVTIPFENVHGRLRSGDRPVGFAVASGGISVFDTRLAGNAVVLRLSGSRMQAEGAQILYGAGSDPICNITDEADRAVPVFGPIFAGGLRAVLPFIRRFEVTDLLPGAGKLSAVNYPADCTWRVQEYPADFANRREEIAAAGDDRLMFYRFRFRVAEPMKLGLLLGYDGPVKAWIDGRQVFHDPKGTNPAIPDAKRVRFTASGEHEVVVALGSNAGNAWGIFARLERFDVTPSQLAAGGYAMPVVV